MAVKARPKKVIDDKRIILIVDDKGEKITNPHALKKMSDDEIVTALRSFGTEKIILAYREAKTDPPVDLLKSYFEHYPKNITPDESILLQKAYGRDFMEAQYIKLLGSAETMKKLNGWQNFWGGVGRIFRRYKRLKHDDSSLILKTLEGVERQLLHSTKDKTNDKNIEDQHTLIDTALQAADRGIDSMRRNAESEVLPDNAEINREGDKNPNITSKLAAAGEQAIDVGSMADNLSVVKTEDESFVDEWKSYNSFICLHGYKKQGFELGMIQFLSKEIGLEVEGKELFTLKNTDFILTYDPMAKSTSVSMSTGTGSIQLGALTLAIEKGYFTDVVSPTFTAEKVRATLQADSFQGSGTIGEVTVDSTGIDFKEVSVKADKVTAFNEGFILIKPMFHMQKDEKGKWIKDIIFGGLEINSDTVSLKFGKGKENAEKPGDNNENAWKLQEKSESIDVATKRDKWEPQIKNATAEMHIGDVFTASFNDITFSQEEMSAQVQEISMSVQLGEEENSAAQVSADKAVYRFAEKSLYLENMNGDVNLTLGGNAIDVKLIGMNYANERIAIDKLTGTIEFLDKKVTLEGGGITYTRDGKLDFESIAGSLEGDLKVLDTISLQSLSLVLAKEKGDQKAIEDAEETQEGSRAGAYEFSIGVGGGSVALPNFTMDVEQASISVTDTWALASIVIQGSKININNNFIQGSVKALSYVKDTETLSAQEASLNLLWYGKAQVVSISNMEYTKKSGISLQGISADLQINVAGNNLMIAVNDTSYQDSVLKVGTASVKMEFMGKDIALEGQGIEISSESFNFTSLSAELGEFKGYGFTLDSAKLELKKEENEEEDKKEDANAIDVNKTKNAYSITVSTGKVGFNAGSTELSAGQTSFVVSKNKLSQASINNAKIGFGGGLFTGTAGSVIYSQNENDMSLDVESLTVDVNTEGGIRAGFSMEKGYYNGKEIVLEGIDGTVGFSMFGVDFDAKVKGGSYKGNTLTIGDASVEANVSDTTLKLSGTGMSYNQKDGFNYKSLSLDTGKSLQIGSILTISNGHLEVDKEKKDDWLTVTGGVAVNIGNTAQMSVKEANFSLAQSGEFLVGMKTATLNVGNDLFAISTGEVTYSSKEKLLQATDLSGKSSIGNVSDVDVNIKSVTYQNKDLSLTGIDLKTNFFFGSNSLYIDVKDGNYAKNQFTIASITSEITIGGTVVTLNAKTLVFSKEKVDFEEIKGDVTGTLSIFDGTGISVDGASICISKDAKDADGAEDAKDTYTTTLKSTSILVAMGGIELGANGMDFGISGGVLTNAHVDSANLAIQGDMITGEVKNLDYNNNQGVYSFSAGSMTAGLNFGESVTGEATIGGIKYEDKKFTLADMNVDFSIVIAGNSAYVNFTNASYDEKKGITAASAGMKVNVLDEKVELIGEELAYSPSNGFNFKKLGAVLKKEINLFDAVIIKDPNVALEKQTQDKCIIKVGAGVSTKGEDIFSLKAANVETTLENNELKDIVIKKAEIKVLKDLIDAKAATLNMSFKDKRISACDLEVSVGSKALGQIPGLSTISEFLSGVGVSVKTFTYSKADGLKYEGLTFTGMAPSIQIGSFLKLKADLANKSIGAYINWMFPGGEMVNVEEPKGKENEGGSDSTKTSNDAPQDKPKAEKVYEAPSLFDFSLDFPIVPGVNLSAGMDIGAGICIRGDLNAKKNDKGYNVNGDLGVSGQAYVGANAGISLGVPGVAVASAKVAADFKLNLGLLAKINTDVASLRPSPTFSNTTAEYKAEGDVNFEIAAVVSGKFLFFSEKVLYKKQFGKWTLGNFAFNDTLIMDPKTGKLEEGEVKKALKFNGNPIKKGEGIGKGFDTETKSDGVNVNATKPQTIDEVNANIDEIQVKRKNLEKLLLDTSITWGHDGTEASKMMVEQVRSISEIYEEELKSMYAKLSLLKADVEDYKVLATVQEALYNDAEIVSKNMLNIKVDEGAFKGKNKEETKKVHGMSKEEMKGQVLFNSGGFKEKCTYGELKELYYRNLTEKYLHLAIRKVDELEGYVKATVVSGLPGINNEGELKKEYSGLTKRFTDLEQEVAKRGESSTELNTLHQKVKGNMSKIGELLKLASEEKKKGKQDKSNKNITPLEAFKWWEDRSNLELKNNVAKEEGVKEKRDQLISKWKAYELAENEIKELQTLNKLVQSFLSNKNNLEEYVMKDIDRDNFKEICSKIEQRKIKENLETLTKSEDYIRKILKPA